MRTGHSFKAVCLSYALFLCVGFLLSLPAYAQRENIWAFNQSSGLNFNNLNSNNLPVPETTSFAYYPWIAPASIISLGNWPQTAASICDWDGNLLFYTEGSNIWDRQHNPMPNGKNITGLETLIDIYYKKQLGPVAITDGRTVIVPMIDSFDKYFVFSVSSVPFLAQPTVGQAANAGKLFCSVVDMNLNNGMGDVVPGRKGIVVDSQLAAKIVAVPGDNCNIWLLVQDREERSFKAYEITSKGINPNPVISTIGFTGMLPLYYLMWHGGLTVSPNGKKLARTQSFTYSDISGSTYAKGGIDVFDFNPATGVVSNYLSLDNNYLLPLARIHSYNRAAFSPDNSKVYGTLFDDVAWNSSSDDFPHWLAQFDLNDPNPPSTKTIVDSSSGTDVKLGPDGKIYYDQTRINWHVYPQVYENALNVITKPNERGRKCSRLINAVKGAPGQAWVNRLTLAFFPNIVPIVRRDTVMPHQKDVYICSGEKIFISAADTTGKWYKWDSINPPDTAAKGQHTREVYPGMYVVRYYTSNPCAYHVDSFVVHAQIPITVNLGNDTLICDNLFSLTLNATQSDLQFTYLWPDGSTKNTYAVNSSGRYWVEVDHMGCKASDTINVTYIDVKITPENDTVLCGQTEYRLNVKTNAPSSILWSNGSMDSSIVVTSTGAYWVKAMEEICSKMDTVNVRFINLYTKIEGDTSRCYNDPESILMIPTPKEGNILWSTGNKETFTKVVQPGVYSVMLYEDHCVYRDTVTITENYCNCIAEMPNAFTPNDDGLNDIFRPVVSKSCPLQSYRLQIYSRWGELLFTTETIGTGWDGTHNGERMDAGTYYFQVNYKLIHPSQPTYVKGDVTLIR